MCRRDFGLRGYRWRVWRGELRPIGWARLKGEGDEARRPVRWRRDEESQEESECQWG